MEGELRPRPRMPASHEMRLYTTGDCEGGEVVANGTALARSSRLAGCW